MTYKPFEQFTLILKHEYVYPNGEHVEIHRPMVTKYSHGFNEEIPHAVIVNHMLKKLEEYVIKVYSEERKEE